MHKKPTWVKKTDKNPKNKPLQSQSGRLAFSNDVIAYNSLRNRFVDKSTRLEKEYVDFYKNRKHTFDDLFDVEIPEVVHKVIDATHFGVSVLMEYGIDDIDDNALAAMVSENGGIRQALDFIYQKAEKIEELAISLGEYRSIQRAGRGHWEGGGFGVRGAIKGALTAGAFNLGTNMFRGIGDSLTNSSDRARISKLKQALANDPSILECLQDTVYSYCMNVFYAVNDILVENDKIPFVEFDPQNALARAKNYVMQFNSDATMYGKAVDALCEGIQSSPYTTKLYFELYCIYRGDKQSIHKLASFFGNTRKYRKLLIKYDSRKVNTISEKSEESISQIDDKIQAYRLVLKDNPYIDLSAQITKLKEKRNDIEEREKKEAATQSICNSILQKRKKYMDYLAAGKEEQVCQAAYDNDLFALYELKLFYYNKAQPSRGDRTSTVQAMPLILEKLGSADFDTGIIMQYSHRWKTDDLLARYLYVFLLYTVIDNMGWLSRNGRDDDEKSECYRQMIALAKQNNIMAIGDLGYIKCTYLPVSTATAKEEGLKMLKEATSKLEPFALLHLGQGYKDGKWGLPRNSSLADHYLSLVAAYGLQVAKSELDGKTKGAATSNSSSDGCFITSAVCRSFNKPDDCYELTVFRGFRDNWLSKQEDGIELIREYYAIAPKIVNEIDNLADSSTEYLRIWDEYLQQCLSYIEKGELNRCKSLYCTMVHSLKEKYCRAEWAKNAH